MADRYSIRDWIIENIPEYEGYGNFNNTLINNIPNHTVFKHSLRKDHEGDINVSVTYTTDDWTLKYCKLKKSEIQIVVNAVKGDIEEAEALLEDLFSNLNDNNGNEKIQIYDCKMVNLRTVGKNSSGIHWSVLNILIRYRLM